MDTNNPNAAPIIARTPNVPIGLSGTTSNDPLGASTRSVLGPGPLFTMLFELDRDEARRINDRQIITTKKVVLFLRNFIFYLEYTTCAYLYSYRISKYRSLFYYDLGYIESLNIIMNFYSNFLLQFVKKKSRLPC